MQTRVYIFAEKILTLQKITPAILPFKNLTWESKNGEGGEGVSSDQSPVCRLQWSSVGQVL